MWGPIESLFFSDANENCAPGWNDFVNNSHGLINPPDKVGGLEPHVWAWIWSGIAAVLATIITGYSVYQHCINYTSKYQQRLIVRILFMVPIYALDSFFSFRFYFYGVYFDLARDCYEAFVINNFFCLMIEYAGGYESAKETIASKGHIRLIMPLNCITISSYRGTIRTLKKIALQYVLIRPIVSVLAVILQANHIYCAGNYNLTRGYIYITFILFCSVTAAMYALIMFYNLFADNMKEYHPLGKFLAVKFVIFLSFWQSIVVAFLVYLDVVEATATWSTDNISSGIQNVLICTEMLIASIVHISVFSHKPYMKEGVKTPVWNVLFKYVFSLKDVAKDIRRSFFPGRKYRKNKKSKRRTPANDKIGLTGETNEVHDPTANPRSMERDITEVKLDIPSPPADPSKPDGDSM